MKSIRMLHHSDAFLFTEPQKANIGTLLWICGTFFELFIRRSLQKKSNII